MKKPVVAALGGLGLALSGLALAGDVDVGKALFEAQCADCHYGDDFAGEDAEAIAGLIQGVVSGEVEHKTDLPGLSAEDVANIAAFWASHE